MSQSITPTRPSPFHRHSKNKQEHQAFHLSDGLKAFAHAADRFTDVADVGLHSKDEEEHLVFHLSDVVGGLKAAADAINLFTDVVDVGPPGLKPCLTALIYVLDAIQVGDQTHGCF